jgi:sulfane dehydrogenase subunit SoxC
MAQQQRQRGRIQLAPENHISAEQYAAARSARRGFIRAALGGAAAAGGALLGGAAAAQPAVEIRPGASNGLGAPVVANGYGMPSKFEASVIRRISPGLTRTDQQHRLMIHGLVRRPLILTMNDLMRYPSVSRIHFIECGANSGMEWGNVATPSVQYTHGMLACSEFTGVPLSTVLDEAGIDRAKSKYILAEGACGSHLTRTVPIAMALDDVLLVYGQNGEMLRPENGYPLRLLVPGVQGVSSVKWLRRIEVGDAPWNTREESLHYIDLMPDGTHRQYTWVQEVKSVITSPSGGQKLLDRGYYEVTGLAWSGRGRIRRVDVSADGGRNWRTARLQQPVLPKALTRFRIDWSWDGSPALLQSRAVDETGHVQPTINQLRAVRGSRSIYHNNTIHTWRLAASGEVSNVQLG